MSIVTGVFSATVVVADQDRALAFYRDLLGCEVRTDAEVWPGARVVEVVPPGSSVAVALLSAEAGLPIGVRWRVADAAAAHADLRAAGVTVHSEVLHLPGSPPMFTAEDPDGNTVIVMEDPERVRPPEHEFTDGRYGHVTHTQLSSTDPDATREWAEQALGWTFHRTFPTPSGDVHLFAYSDTGGGGIGPVAPGEQPGTVPSVHVRDTDAAYADALDAGAEPVDEPTTLGPGVRVAAVRAPGGVVVGLPGPS